MIFVALALGLVHLVVALALFRRPGPLDYQRLSYALIVANLWFATVLVMAA